MNSLFDIDTALLQALDNAEPNELGEFASEELDGLTAEREMKLENIGLYIKTLDYKTKALKAEEQALAERRKQAEKKAEWLKGYAANSIANYGAIETTRIKMTVRKSESVKLDISLLQTEYYKSKTTWEPDKQMIKDKLKEGKEIAGATLEIKHNLQIK